MTEHWREYQRYVGRDGLVHIVCIGEIVRTNVQFWACSGLVYVTENETLDAVTCLRCLAEAPV